ncbi:MAG: hypothetical protein AAF674_10740 [Pseudomonadota bacterium]
MLPEAAWRFVRRWGTAVGTPVRFALRTGHFRSSIAERAVDRRGKPLPWYTYPAINLVQAGTYTGRTVLEFGGGQSTLWWAARADRVITIEPSLEWAEMMTPQLPDNATMIHVPVDFRTRDVSAVKAAIVDCGVEEFDLIIVDGHLRLEVAYMARPMLSADGAMIFDNADGFDFQKFYASCGMMRVDLYGWSPGVSRQSVTSICFSSNCFLFRPKKQIFEPEAKFLA